MKLAKSVTEKDIKLLFQWFNNMCLTVNFEQTVHVPFSCNASTNPTFLDRTTIMNFADEMNEAALIKLISYSKLLKRETNDFQIKSKFGQTIC